ncbi:hypothetical protein [Candidatus Minimicrobia vallesae]
MVGKRKRLLKYLERTDFESYRSSCCQIRVCVNNLR